MARELRLPQARFPKILEKLPLEDQVDALLNNLNKKIARSPITSRLENFRSQLPTIPEYEIPTPFGRVRLPKVDLPEVAPPQMNGRRREALKAAVATDLSSVIGVIPIIGDVIADVIEDTFGAKIKGVLTSGEQDLYMKYDKLGPSTLAMVRTFVRREG